jgi:hypothetical protein
MSPYKDPNKAREYDRAYQRKRRAQVLGEAELPTRFKVESTADLQEILDYMTNALPEADIDAVVKPVRRPSYYKSDQAYRELRF